MSNRFKMLWLLILNFVLYALAHDVDFERAFQANPSGQEIPKTAHFIFAYVKPAGWVEYVAIRSAIDNLGAETVNLCVPTKTQFEGDMWKEILKLPSVKVRELDMPDRVYGRKLQHAAHIADVLRLKTLYSEGGVYMDTNLFALRSSDDVINKQEHSAVVAREKGIGFCSAMIMSKPGSSFLKTWMKTYRIFTDLIWNFNSGIVPYLLYVFTKTDLTVLGDRTWFYPMWGSNSQGMYTMWLGKSWNMTENYGVHLWHWERAITDHFTKDTIREIDTSFFCAVRPLLDNYAGDGYVSTPAHSNPNCSITTMSSLNSAPGLISRYNFGKDTSSSKWVDTSGNNLHGWALNGTALVRLPADASKQDTVGRLFKPGSFAVLPVPADYDALTGSMNIQFQSDWSSSEVTLVKYRLDYWQEILIQVVSSGGKARIRFQWTSGKWWQFRDSFDWTTASFDATDSFHDLSVAFDRKTAGMVSISIDGRSLGVKSIRTLTSPRIALDLWINARSDKELDSGFRGTLRELSVYHIAPKNGPDLPAWSRTSWYTAPYQLAVISGVFVFICYRLRLTRYPLRMVRGLYSKVQEATTTKV